MTTRQQVPALVSSHSVFNANGTLFAKIVDDFYAVFSYGEHFPIAIRRRSVDEPWLVNEDGYSSTTARHKSIVRSGIERSGRPHLTCSTQNLKRLLAGGV